MDDNIKTQFRRQLYELMQDIPLEEMIPIDGDLNGHFGNNKSDYEMVHGGYDFGERNVTGENILDFVMAYDLKVGQTRAK